MSNTKRALIIGAGITGLATALTLSRRGWSVKVFERASAFEAVGAGIQLAPNGMKVLRALAAPLIRLSYGKMVLMALPYTIVLTAVGLVFVVITL
ncbi:MAG: FAD-dependent oxidoreductase [Alphaproteobacteria bacterium]